MTRFRRIAVPAVFLVGLIVNLVQADDSFVRVTKVGGSTPAKLFMFDDDQKTAEPAPVRSVDAAVLATFSEPKETAASDCNATCQSAVGCHHGCGSCNGCGNKLCGCRCNMPPHYPYFPALHGYYYFRPYHHLHIEKQRQTAIQWGEDPRNPYANSVFARVYEEYRAQTGK